jgi:hypothetical protein
MKLSSRLRKRLHGEMISGHHHLASAICKIHNVLEHCPEDVKSRLELEGVLSMLIEFSQKAGAAAKVLESLLTEPWNRG